MKTILEHPRTIFLFVVVIVALARPLSANACSCIMASPSKSFERAVLVFTGTPFAVKDTLLVFERDGLGDFRSQRRVFSFDVAHIWKGETRKQVDVSTGTSGNTCGITYNLDKEYVVYCNEGYGRFNSGRCNRNIRSHFATWEHDNLKPIQSFVGDPSSVDEETLWKHLNGGDIENSGRAAAALAELPDSLATLARLSDIVMGREIGDKRAALMAMVLFRSHAAEQIPTIHWAFTNGDPTLRSSAVYLATRTTVPMFAKEMVWEALGDPSSKVREAASTVASYVARTANEEEHAKLCELLHKLWADTAANVRASAVSGSRACTCDVSNLLDELEAMARYDPERIPRLTAKSVLRHYDREQERKKESTK